MASFLGARAIDRGDFTVLSAGALLAFITTILLCVYVLAPRQDLKFALQGPGVFEHFTRTGNEMQDVFRSLSYWIEEAIDHNQALMDRLFRCYRAACGFLIAEIVLWSAKLSGTLG